MYVSTLSQGRSSLDRYCIELESADHPLAVERTHGHHAQARRRDSCFDNARRQQALMPEIFLKLGEVGPSPVKSASRNVGRARSKLLRIAFRGSWLGGLMRLSVRSIWSKQFLSAPFGNQMFFERLTSGNQVKMLKELQSSLPLGFLNGSARMSFGGNQIQSTKGTS
jgi:hypothetical protein